jgi:5-hydroxyisourate hydrolase
VSHVTTHILDSALGTPAAGVDIVLRSGDETIASGTTNSDGRVPELGPELLAPGDYSLTFDTAGYFGNNPHFYPSVTIAFTITDDSHYHVPLLLSPFGYSTYRGS